MLLFCIGFFCITRCLIHHWERYTFLEKSWKLFGPIFMTPNWESVWLLFCLQNAQMKKNGRESVRMNGSIKDSSVLSPSNKVNHKEVIHLSVSTLWTPNVCSAILTSCDLHLMIMLVHVQPELYPTVSCTCCSCSTRTLSDSVLCLLLHASHMACVNILIGTHRRE